MVRFGRNSHAKKDLTFCLLDKMDAGAAPFSPATPSGVATRTTMSRRMIEYAKVIQELNERRLVGQPFGLVSSLLQVSQAFDDREMPRKSELVNTFNLLRKLVGEDNVRLDGSFARAPRTEAEFFSRTDEPKIKQTILDSAKSFLEEQYWTFVQQKCASNLSSAPLGGRMSKANYCRAFVNIVVPSELKEANYFELDGNVRDASIPAWGVLYYCLRCGDLNEAMEYAQATPVLANFVPFLRSYISNNREVYASLAKLPSSLVSQFFQARRPKKQPS
jgi:nuclear pore complex protein Nup93